MKLTSSENAAAAKRAMTIHGLSTSKVNEMLDDNRRTGRDNPKLKAFSETYQRLLDQARTAKLETRQDKPLKKIIKTFEGASSERRYKEYLAQVKPGQLGNAESSAWIRRCFFDGKSLRQSEMVALMSYSNQSSMKPTDPVYLERTNGCDEPSLVRAAAIFCKRFGL